MRTAAELRLENILATAADAIITIDKRSALRCSIGLPSSCLDIGRLRSLASRSIGLSQNEARDAHRMLVEQFATDSDISRPMNHRRQVIGQRRDGSRFAAEAGISKLSTPGNRSLTVIIRDVSDRQAAEVALQDSEARYRSIIEAMEEGVVFQDAGGHILTCNASAERILGLSLDQLAGRTSLDPRWQALHEDGSSFPGRDHPAIIALRTGQSQSNVVMGVTNPTAS